jgi:hypothetical protein
MATPALLRLIDWRHITETNGIKTAKSSDMILVRTDGADVPHAIVPIIRANRYDMDKMVDAIVASNAKYPSVATITPEFHLWDVNIEGDDSPGYSGFMIVHQVFTEMPWTGNDGSEKTSEHYSWI